MPAQSSDSVFQNIRFRNCVHRGIAGATPEAIMAAVSGAVNEVCAPIVPPAEAGNVFIGTAQVLGDDAFRMLWATFQKQDLRGRPSPMDFPRYLAGHALAKTMPQLPDLAAFDFAYFLAAQPSPMPSLGACCLTEALARAHPELMLRFQPGWRYLVLDWPVHRLLAEAATLDGLRALSGGATTYLRIAPGTPGVVPTELTPAVHAFETALRNGMRLSDATIAATALDSALDPFPMVAALAEAGAIIDAILHPADMPPLSNPQRSRP